MKFALIESGNVTNIIEADAQYAASVGAIDATGAAIGDLWDGTAFTKTTPGPVVPQSVTMRQARLALHAAGLLTSVDAAIAAMPETDKTAAQITWDYASSVDRGFGMVPQLAEALGMTETQIDELFIAASQL